MLDGVSFQEVWILTIITKHIEHLDKVLIQPSHSDNKSHFKTRRLENFGSALPQGLTHGPITAM